ncbi:MAG: TIGR03905 family TSCPD domain-containing protein [Treponema sp.]|nr:TIGR03905 family TSCPD domain-containing protein [Treponema sp.]
MTHTYNTKGTCSTRITFDKAEDGTITNVAFTGGCNGNLKAVSKLVDGMKALEIYEKLHGNTCGSRPTSCADQLAKAVMEA